MGKIIRAFICHATSIPDFSFVIFFITLETRQLYIISHSGDGRSIPDKTNN